MDEIGKCTKIGNLRVYTDHLGICIAVLDENGSPVKMDAEVMKIVRQVEHDNRLRNSRYSA
jgi:hypothetical protein